MTINKRIAITVASVAMTGAIGATALASSHSNAQANTRPGWGNGDKNHVHTGPPGQSVNVGKNGDDTRPGKGEGDKNHVHTGPPGQSVNVGDENGQEKSDK